MDFYAHRIWSNAVFDFQMQIQIACFRFACKITMHILSAKVHVTMSISTTHWTFYVPIGYYGCRIWELAAIEASCAAREWNVLMLSCWLSTSRACRIGDVHVARTQNIVVAILLAAMWLVCVANTQGTWERGPTWALIDGKLSGY